VQETGQIAPSGAAFVPDPINTFKVLEDAYEALTCCALALRYRKELQTLVNKTVEALKSDKGGSGSFAAHEKLLRGERAAASPGAVCSIRAFSACAGWLLEGNLHNTCCYGRVACVCCQARVGPSICGPLC
jgi:hypothetical protein